MKKRKPTINWNEKFSTLGAILRALLFAIVNLFLFPVRLLSHAMQANARQSAAQGAQQAAEQGNDRVAEMEAALERRLASKRAQTPKPAKRMTPSATIGALVKDLADGKPLDIIMAGDLDPAYLAWISNLTQAQAIEASRHSNPMLMLHLRGEVSVPGLPPRPTPDQERDMFAALKEANRRPRFPEPPKAHRLHDVLDEEPEPAFG